MRYDVTKALAFLALLWGLYALSRVITIYTEGALGSFGQQWLLIETSLCLISGTLLWAVRKQNLPQSSLINEVI